jgi:two-component system nitrate/nitrite response regulator NarL
MASLVPVRRAEVPSEVIRRPIRVLVALGSPLDCQLLSVALKRSRQQIEIVAFAVSKDTVLSCVSQANVDVALLNVDLEDGRFAGVEVLHKLHLAYENTPVIMLFDTWQDDLVVHAFRSGAAGVFCRSEKKLDMLWKCISSVYDGQVWANSGQLRLLLRALRAAAPVEPIRANSLPGVNLLTTRETQLANLVTEGLPNKEVARRLGLSEHTVSNYLFRIYNKLGLCSRVELVLYIMKRREDCEKS